MDPTEYFQRQWEDMDPMTAEINRLTDEVKELKDLVADLVQGARRDRSIITPSAGPLHVIETSVTKAQVMRAISAVRPREGQTYD
jgi:hypothetical protein